ncbi:alpha/beta hydrolase [Brevundimonas sp. NIBR11]|uniref:alpha/beta fold hydrolase n=1 Tax=Brevundimonas sp. NIBR11 TaxID=3015999 RepID=UPI0022F00AC7|nr:alpha/beta hydrolase [Brevundimonas sp. NIBR11]WGM31856.1 Putative non-heme bromoperoxidase BpoC [Brevundimonas sp. NIBR11]
MPSIISNGTRIHWDQSGSGVPILLIMGHRFSAEMWYPLKEAMADRYRLIWFDNQGTGQSESRARTSVEEMTADALAVLDAAEVDSAHVYGVSMGGGICLEFGIRYPERARSLILGCTMAKTPDIPPRRKWLISVLYRLMPLLKGLASKKFKSGYGDAAPDDRIARDQAVLAKDPFSMRGVIAQSHAIIDYSVTPEEVAAVTLPALVLHGTQDLAVPYEAGVKLSQMLPNARLVTFQDIGHNYFIGAGDEAQAAVETFIQEVEAAR